MTSKQWIPPLQSTLDKMCNVYELYKARGMDSIQALSQAVAAGMAAEKRLKRGQRAGHHHLFEGWYQTVRTEIRARTEVDPYDEE